jgi:ubiquinone/menaquinone biosynthesis C-methylase UbiE
MSILAHIARSLLYAPRTRSARLELLDAPVIDRRELASNLADIRAVNCWLGDNSSMLHLIKHLCQNILADPKRHRKCQDILILDVATGSADVPLAVKRWADRSEMPVRVYASDMLMDVLHEADCHTCGDIPLMCHDVLHLPYEDNAIDIITFSKALHHFRSDEAKSILCEMARVARHGVVINDLHRSWLAYWVAHLLGVVQKSPISRHDGPLSVLRAYTIAELCELLGQAGLQAHVCEANLYRLIVVVGKSASVA